jgi:hypothetical protein
MIRPVEPRRDFPARATPSVRRLMFLDYDWIDAFDVRVHGEARDELTDADGATRVASQAGVDVETREGVITAIGISPDELDVAPLLGHPLRQGFRSRVRPLHDAGGRPLGLLLDDLPGAMIAAGYVPAMERRIGPGTSDADEMPRGFHQADLCSGWRADGTMMIAVRAGNFLPFEPLAPVDERPTGSEGWPRVPSRAPVCAGTGESTSSPKATCGVSTRGSATPTAGPTARAAHCTSTRWTS